DVDHRRSAGGGAGLRVADDDDVGVRLDDARGILDGLPLGRRRGLPGVLGREDLPAEPDHRRLEAQARARARFEEEGRHDPAAEPVGAAGSHNHAHLVGAREELFEEGAVELLHGEDTARTPRTGHHLSFLLGRKRAIPEYTRIAAFSPSSRDQDLRSEETFPNQSWRGWVDQAWKCRPNLLTSATEGRSIRPTTE